MHFDLYDNQSTCLFRGLYERNCCCKIQDIFMNGYACTTTQLRKYVFVGSSQLIQSIIVKVIFKMIANCSRIPKPHVTQIWNTKHQRSTILSPKTHVQIVSNQCCKFWNLPLPANKRHFNIFKSAKYCRSLTVNHCQYHTAGADCLLETLAPTERWSQVLCT